MSTPTSISSLVFQDGFDYYNNTLTKWSGGSLGCNFTSPGRFGYGQCLQVSYGGNGSSFQAILFKALPNAPYSRIVMGCAFNFQQTTISSDSVIGIIDTNGNVIGGVNIGALGRIYYTADSSHTSAPGVIPVEAWVYLEMDVILSTTGTGSYMLRVNGQTVVTNTGVSTGAQAYGICLATYGGYISKLIDDIYVLAPTGGTLGDSFLGDIKIVPLVPNGNGRINQWTETGGVSGANWNSVKEIPPDNDTSYVSTNTVGQIDCYTVPLLNSITPVSAVYGVSLYAYARKDDSPARFVSVGVGNGTTESFDSGSALGSTYSYVQRVLPTNPLTSANWALSDFNNIQIALKLIS